MSDKSDPVIHMKAGAISALVNCVSLQPFDLIKTRLQQDARNTIKLTIHDVLRHDGYRGLWRGTFATVIRNVPGVSAYFTTLEILKQRIKSYTNKDKLSAELNLLTGGFARVLIGLMVMPVTVVKSRLESNLYQYTDYEYKGVFDATKMIIRNDGLKGFFYGFGSTALRDAPYAGIYLFLYEHSKDVYEDHMPASTTLKTFILSGSSGFLATMVTHPFDVIRTRIQLQPDLYRNTVICAMLTYRKDGIGGFMAGLLPRIVRKTISAAITWTIYEELLRMFEKQSS